MKLSSLFVFCSSLITILALPTHNGVVASLEARNNDDGGQIDSRSNWVGSWTAMPQLCEPANLPPAPFNASSESDAVFVDTTLRQTIKLTLGGRGFRLRFSNAFGGTVLPISSVSVACTSSFNGSDTGVSTIDQTTIRPVTFNGGEEGYTIPTGSLAVSDPIDWAVQDGALLSISMYLQEGKNGSAITAHPGSRTTSYLISGNHTVDADLQGATTVDHWYYISGIEVVAERDDAAAIVVVGDSITDGRGSDTNENNRWTDDFATRLQQANLPLSVLNQGAGGNRILADGLGPNALSRIDRDVLAQTRVKYAIIFEGVNDIGTAANTSTAQAEVVEQLKEAYRQMVERLHAQKIVVYAGTITPFGNNSYDDPAGLRAASRVEINDWLRNNSNSDRSGLFDGLLDFDAAVRDDSNGGKTLKPEYDVGGLSGDGLHPNPKGYQAMADSIPLELFQ